MSVTLPPLPDEVRQAFLRGLDDFLPRNQELRHHISANPGDILAIPIYRLLPDQLRASSATDAAELVAWHILAATAEDGIAADVARLQPRSPFVLTSATVGNTVPALVALVQTVLTKRAPPDRDFELRLLRMKSAYLEVAWLKSTNDGPDLFVPVASGLSEVKPNGETYTAEKLFQHARATAQRTTGFLMRPNA
ncbi:MAG: hypothetical protein IPJ98_29925 [Bryobacterales bacterium]|nr:hypothetical protein [Bryobacterales bacterium]